MALGPDDFLIEEHAAKSASAFSIARPRYEGFCEEVYRIISRYFTSNESVKIHKIEYRAKNIDSFKKKCLKLDETKSYIAPKYRDPIVQITDLAAVRVILFFPDSVKEVCDFVDANFEVVEKRDVGEDRYTPSGNFGYQSIHYLVKLNEKRATLQENRIFIDLICEIQIRTILQHAWAEMEHDIQYKSSDHLPTDIRRKFTALAGMLEIADREFQSIQTGDAKLKDTIRKSLENQLTKETISSFSTPITATDGNSELAEPQPATPTVSARELVVAGSYDKAVIAYTKLIETSPTSHTLYLGRAKARFLAGDRDGALKDIDCAGTLSPKDTSVNLIRTQIENGSIQRPPAEPGQANAALRQGNAALCLGDGEAAFEYFSQANELGHNTAFSIFNKAMACTLVKDTKGARHYVDALTPPLGSPMEINAIALKIINDCIDNIETGDQIEILSQKIANMHDFSFFYSPLRNLEQGFISKQDALLECILKVFSVLKII